VGSSTKHHHFLNTVIAQATIYSMNRKPTVTGQSNGTKKVLFSNSRHSPVG